MQYKNKLQNLPIQMITVVKRSGERVPLDIEKIQRQVAFACKGIADVSPSMVEMKSQLELHDGVSTSTIDELLLKAMVNLIDEIENPDIGHTNYQYVAGRQRLMMLRKEVCGQYEPGPLYDTVKRNVEAGVYTPDLLTWYSEEEWHKLDSYIDHSKDEDYAYAAVEQLAEKYLVRNRVTNKIYETPQTRYMIAAATAFHADPKAIRLKNVKEFYQSASDGLFTLATPVLAGLGTPTKQFSSCVLIKVNDTLDSIFAGGEMMAKYASKRAGIGLEIGRLRPIGSPIRGGEIKHTGMVPFLKKWFGDLRSCCLHPDMLVEILDEEKTSKTVKMSNTVTMSALKKGMKIKTMDGNAIVFKTITDVFETDVPQPIQVRLELENGCIINCSINHPIMVKSGLEVIQKLPMELTPDDLVIAEYGFTRLKTIDLGQYNDPVYIDITVEDTHTFFTKSSIEQSAVLTHNSQGGIRNACLEKGSVLNVLRDVEIDGKTYALSDYILYEGTPISVYDLLKTKNLIN